MLLWKAVWTSISRGCCSIGWEPEDVAGGPAVRRPRSGGRPLRLWAAPEAHPVWRCPSGSVWRTGALANGFSGKTKLLKNRPYGGHYPTQSALALLESSCKILATASLGNYPKRSPIFAEWKGLCVIPAQAAVQAIGSFTFWIPAFAGMTPLTRRRLCRRRPLPPWGEACFAPSPGGAFVAAGLSTARAEACWAPSPGGAFVAAGLSTARAEACWAPCFIAAKAGVQESTSTTGSFFVARTRKRTGPMAPDIPRSGGSLC